MGSPLGWANHHVIIKCDNQAAIAMINKGSTPNPKVMVWLRDLFWLSAIYNFCITAVYIKGSHNIIADSLSRMHDRISLLKLYLLLYSSCPPSNILNDSLVSHMSLISSVFLSHRFISGFSRQRAH